MRFQIHALVLLVLLPIGARGQGSPGDNCSEFTGRMATLIVPASAELTLDGAPLQRGDIVSVVTPNGVCAGRGTYEPGTALAIPVWEDNPFTEDTDGFADGEPVSFQVYRPATGALGEASGRTPAVSADAAFDAPTAFSADAVYVVTRLATTSLASGSESHLGYAFALSGAYPNPFRGQTRFTYEVPAAGDVRLEIFDLLGRRVATLVDEHRGAGRYEVAFSAEQAGEPLAAGVYIARLQAGDHVASVRLTLVR